MRLREFEDDFGAFARELDADVVPVTEAKAAVERLARIEHMVAASRARLAGRVAESTVWRTDGAASAVDWLAKTTGTTAQTARDELAAARRLRHLPQVDAAARRGELSMHVLTAVSDAAVADPAAAPMLLGEAASGTLGSVREACRTVKANADPDADATYRRHRANRRWWDATGTDGEWRFGGGSTPDDGAVVRAALDPIVDELFATARREGRREPRCAYALDALVEACRRLLDGRVADPDVPDGPPCIEKKRRRARYLGIIRADVEALRRGRTEGDETCDIAGLGPIPVRVAAELLGDAVLQLVLTNGIDVANVTHLSRKPTVAQRAALAWTNPGCTVHGCTGLRIELDHRADWARTRHTRLDELDPLCHHHHRLKTRENWALVAGTGRRRMVPPDDPDHPANAGRSP